jgi:hypothetical protein
MRITVPACCSVVAYVRHGSQMLVLRAGIRSPSYLSSSHYPCHLDGDITDIPISEASSPVPVTQSHVCLFRFCPMWFLVTSVANSHRNLYTYHSIYIKHKMMRVNCSEIKGVLYRLQCGCKSLSRLKKTFRSVLFSLVNRLGKQCSCQSTFILSIKQKSQKKLLKFIDGD